jgi:hypothetical protein
MASGINSDIHYIMPRISSSLPVASCVLPTLESPFALQCISVVYGCSTTPIESVSYSCEGCYPHISFDSVRKRKRENRTILDS